MNVCKECRYNYFKLSDDGITYICEKTKEEIEDIYVPKECKYFSDANPNDLDNE